jgi:parallel beta-helix repeat protein
MEAHIAVAVGVLLLSLVGIGSFVASPTASTPAPAEFDRTVSVGLTAEDRLEAGDDGLLPRAEVVYSQYPYVVGYRGVGLAASAVDDPLVVQRFGYPRAVYLEAAPPDVRLDGANRLLGNHTGEWIPAADAHVVVESDARTPAGPTPVAFESRRRADRFVSKHGGRVLGWEARQQFSRTRSGGETARDRIDTHHDSADATVAEATALLERPTGIVVGVDEPTLRAALEAAAANTTVRLPPGTYEGPVVIEESITLAGRNATIAGDGTDTVITVRADDVAITGVSITGVGASLRDDTAEGDGWDRRTEEAYGYADAGITAAAVDRVLVRDTRIETPGSGVVLRDTNESVVDNVTVYGAETWEEGFMGVVAMRSAGVVQRSRFVGGRDGVYTHRSSGITVRDNRFEGGRFGIHLMYTSDALVAGNCASGQEIAGITVMTGPSGTVLADNVVVDTGQGILTGGFDAYVGGNVVVGNGQGISTSARNSLYAANTVVGNDLGFRASSVFPTSVVVRNDVVGNDRHVSATTGPLRVWTHAGEGNYWGGAERLERPYSPTDPVDGRLHRTAAARALSAAPVISGLRAVRRSAPGTRSESVVDAAPRSRPASPDRLRTAMELANGTTTVEELECRS